MTIRRQVEWETILFALIAAVLASFFVWRNNQSNKNQFSALSPIASSNSAPAVVSPVVSPVLKIDTQSQISPDGTKKLLLKTTQNVNGTRSYEVFTTDGSGNNTQPVYTTILGRTDSLNIPFNTWSPDNKYFFLQKNTTDALVLKATGEPIDGDQVTEDITDTFVAKNIPNHPLETTGWASPTLLIVNTTATDGTRGPSYWFEVPTKAILQLSGQF